MPLYVFGIAVVLCACTVMRANAESPQAVRDLLSNPKVEQLYGKTYASLVERVQPDGFFQESLTGAYPGMFPRTVGALVALFAETGEWKKARDVVDVCMRAAQEYGLDRHLHIFDRPLNNVPVENSDAVVVPEFDYALYRLDPPYQAAQRFVAGARPVRAVAVLVAAVGTGTMHARLTADPEEGPIYAETKVDITDRNVSMRWLRLEFPSPVQLPNGQDVWLKLQWSGAGIPLWFGRTDAAGHRWAGGQAKDAQQWYRHPANLASFAIDTGRLRFKSTKGDFLAISRNDQLDGNLHVIWGWAKVAESGVDPQWADRTWKQAARQMDVASDWPYLPIQLAPMWPGLARNVCFEHSREGRYWDTHDLLTNCWMAEALRAMAAEAGRRGDAERQQRWTQRLHAVEAAIHAKLVAEIDGKRIYAEMRLPDGWDGSIYDGLSWVNWAPWQTDWKGADPHILRNTLDVCRSKMERVYNGNRIIYAAWGPEGHVSQQVIGKGVGWDIDACPQYGEWDRIAEWLRFLAETNTAELYAEAFNYVDGRMAMQDPGNGEQCAWWCQAIARARKAVGLPVVPNAAK